MVEADSGIDADADVVAGQQPPSARTTLDRERIVAAAIAFIDESGLTGAHHASARRRPRGRGDVALPLRPRPREPPGRRGDRDHGRDAGRRGGPRHPARRVAGLPAAAGPRRTPGGAGAPQGVPAGRLASRGGAVAAPTAAQPVLGRGVPGRADRRGVQRRRRRRGLPGVHQLPAGSPAPRGGRARRRRRARSTCSRAARTCRRASRRTPRSAGWATPWPRTTRRSSSRSPWRTCWTGSR